MTQWGNGNGAGGRGQRTTHVSGEGDSTWSALAPDARRLTPGGGTLTSIYDYRPIDIRRHMARRRHWTNGQGRLPVPPQHIGGVLVWVTAFALGVLVAALLWALVVIGAGLLLDLLGK